MPDSPGDDHDSRTASVGLQRNSRGNSSNGSRPGSVDPSANANANANPRKRQRRNGRSSGDARDFVPQGGAFSASPLPVDPESETSSSGSDSSDSDSDSDSDSGSDFDARMTDAEADTAQTGNWNQGAKSTIRTSLSSRKTSNPEENKENKASAQFDAVNGNYWRSRSESVSSAGRAQDGREGTAEEGEVSEDDDADSSDSSMQLSGDSDDSSLDSEADDSILLNIGSRGQGQNGGLSTEDDDHYDPETLPVAVNGTADIQRAVVGDSSTETKEDAFRRFAQKYPSPPSTLADLNKDDMDILARIVFYDRSVHDINLQLPVTCTECFREGHLAAVCPLKECAHCGAWSKHQSSFCPQWRRCQKCRARGHDEEQCSSPLKSSATETPCDLCGSDKHLELQCDFMWKLPLQEPSRPVLVSISCCRCTSNRHLVGDCPNQPPTQPMLSSSWTLRGIDPETLTNINSIPSSRPGPGNQRGGGLKIRGRADRNSGTSDSDDMIGRPDRRPPMGRNANANRPNIKIGSGIGKNKGFAPAGPRQDTGGRPAYRDRQEFPSGHARQRSLSPNPRPGRGRGRDSWQPPRPRSPPRQPGGGRGRPPPARGSRGGRGGGRGGGKRGGGDGYRPMPSAAKKAWDKYRL